MNSCNSLFTTFIIMYSTHISAHAEHCADNPNVSVLVPLQKYKKKFCEFISHNLQKFLHKALESMEN